MNNYKWIIEKKYKNFQLKYINQGFIISSKNEIFKYEFYDKFSSDKSKISKNNRLLLDNKQYIKIEELTKYITIDNLNKIKPFNDNIEPVIYIYLNVNIDNITNNFNYDKVYILPNSKISNDDFNISNLFKKIINYIYNEYTSTEIINHILDSIDFLEN